MNAVTTSNSATLSQDLGIETQRRGMPRFLTDAAPIALAYLPIAFAFGLSARNYGLSLLSTTLMSLLVYAGASQMIAVGLLAAGQPLSIVFLTTFMVNLRLLLLSAAIAPRVGRWSMAARLFFGFQLTDETFACLAAKGEPFALRQRCSTRFQMVVHGAWVTGSVLGHQLSGMVMDLKPFGLDFALPGMLIGMICLLVTRKRQLFIGLFAASIALTALHFGFGTWGVFVATLAGPTLGLWMEDRWPTRKHS